MLLLSIADFCENKDPQEENAAMGNKRVQYLEVANLHDDPDRGPEHCVADTVLLY